MSFSLKDYNKFLATFVSSRKIKINHRVPIIAWAIAGNASTRFGAIYVFRTKDHYFANIANGTLLYPVVDETNTTTRTNNYKTTAQNVQNLYRKTVQFATTCKAQTVGNKITPGQNRNQTVTKKIHQINFLEIIVTVDEKQSGNTLFNDLYYFIVTPYVPYNQYAVHRNNLFRNPYFFSVAFYNFKDFQNQKILWVGRVNTKTTANRYTKTETTDPVRYSSYSIRYRFYANRKVIKFVLGNADQSITKMSHTPTKILFNTVERFLNDFLITD